MAEENILKTLRAKRDDIESVIVAYQKKIDAARHDLSHVNATIRLFETGQTKEGSRFVDTQRLFRRGEVWTICKAALDAEGPLDTVELAIRLIRSRKLDETDTVLRKALALRAVQALRMQMKRGKIKRLAKRKNRVVWAS